MALRPLLIGLPLEDALVDELLQPGRKDVVRNPGGLKVIEPASAEEGVAHDEQGPPLSDHVERARHRARKAGEAGMPHRTTRYRSPLQDASQPPAHENLRAARPAGRHVPIRVGVRKGPQCPMATWSALVGPFGQFVYADGHG